MTDLLAIELLRARRHGGLHLAIDLAMLALAFLGFLLAL